MNIILVLSNIIVNIILVLTSICLFNLFLGQIVGSSSPPPVLPIAKRCDWGYGMSTIRAWTNDNPGRRFVACPDYDPQTGRRGCTYFHWVDVDDPIALQTQVILNLVSDKEKLQRDLASYKGNIAEANTTARKVQTQYIMLKMQRSGVD